MVLPVVEQGLSHRHELGGTVVRQDNYIGADRQYDLLSLHEDDDDDTDHNDTLELEPASDGDADVPHSAQCAEHAAVPPCTSCEAAVS